MSADYYQSLARQIEKRRIELGYVTVGAFVAATKLSGQAVLNMRNGKARQYSNKVKWGVCAALRWRNDSIDRILSGGKPVVLLPGQVGAVSAVTTVTNGTSRQGDGAPAPAGSHDTAEGSPLAQLAATVDRLATEVEKHRKAIAALQGESRRNGRSAG